MYSVCPSPLIDTPRWVAVVTWEDDVPLARWHLDDARLPAPPTGSRDSRLCSFFGPSRLITLNTFRDTFEFTAEGCPAGTITAFIRISCFGKLIVTQFEVKGKDLFNFKGGDVGVEAGPKGILGIGKGADDLGGSKVKSGTSFQPSAFSTGATNRSSCGQSQGMPFPGQPGQFPGQPGQFPGQPGQCPGQFGQFPGQPASCTQMPPPVLLSQGYQPMDPSELVLLTPSEFTRLFPGTFPCGEPRCPTNACPSFPCSHAAPCNQGNRCSVQPQQFGPPMGMMYPTGMMAPPGMIPPGMMPPGVFQNCPTDRNTQVIVSFSQDMCVISN
ncbi:unnamed protein product [Nesidiocoris tenuis]|uniref:Uncharacterized protein n=1 Tax=Nesidiocoris tenuis TaxID=355587 RepID=A0A6H5G2Q0_9HEMI|nr:unnamed protein product [Nesidiocoris tenuis]